MTTLYVQSDTYEYTDYNSYDSDDNWDRPDSYQRLNGFKVFKDAPPYSYMSVFEVEGEVRAGDRVFVVYADYDTGDTFGRDYGRIDVLEVFINVDDARGLIEAAKSVEPDVDGRIDRSFSFHYNGKEYYKSWAGYFESLNSLDYEDVTVR